MQVMKINGKCRFESLVSMREMKAHAIEKDCTRQVKTYGSHLHTNTQTPNYILQKGKDGEHFSKNIH